MKATSNVVINPTWSERDGVSLTRLGAAHVAREQAELIGNAFSELSGPILATIRAALVFEATWRNCYSGCRCVRCELSEQARQLARTVRERAR